MAKCHSFGRLLVTFRFIDNIIQMLFTVVEAYCNDFKKGSQTANLLIMPALL